jgi:hypothetical protein
MSIPKEGSAASAPISSAKLMEWGDMREARLVSVGASA